MKTCENLSKRLETDRDMVKISLEKYLDEEMRSYINMMWREKETMKNTTSFQRQKDWGSNFSERGGERKERDRDPRNVIFEREGNIKIYWDGGRKRQTEGNKKNKKITERKRMYIYSRQDFCMDSLFLI